MLQSKKPIKQTIIPSKISSAIECKTIALLPWFELTQIFEHEWTKQHVYQKSQHQNATFLCIWYSSKLMNCTMITDKHSQMLIFWCQKSFSDLKLENTPSVHQHWAVWLIITKFIKQNEHYKSASKPIFVRFTHWSKRKRSQPDQEAQRNFANGKSPF